MSPICYCKENRADTFAISEAAEKKAAEQRYQNLHAQGEKHANLGDFI